MRTFFGYLPDPPGHKYTGFHRHAAFRASLVDDASIDLFAPSIWNQRATSSCVGQGTAGGITTTYTAKRIPLSSPASPRFLYTLARAVDRKPVNGILLPLQDQGSEPNQLVRAVGEWGVPLESEVDGGRTAESADCENYLEEHINDEPALDELLAGDERLVVGFNAILSDGDERIREICQSLSDGYAVMAGVNAGNVVFQGHGDGVLDHAGTHPDHWVYFTAFRTVDGKKQILMRNSWGREWAQQGKTWCSERMIRYGLWNILVANLGL